MDEAHAQIVESMFNNLNAYTAGSGTYSDLMTTHSWLHVSGTEYVLSIQILGFQNNQKKNPNEISAEAQKKLEQSMKNAFGEPSETTQMPDDDISSSPTKKSVG